jgi:hypothetical protein
MTRDDIALVLSALMIVEAVSLNVAHTETVAALIAVGASSLIVWLARRASRDTR